MAHTGQFIRAIGGPVDVASDACRMVSVEVSVDGRPEQTFVLERADVQTKYAKYKERYAYEQTVGTIDNLEGRLPKSHVSASGDSGEKNAISVFENSFVANYFLWTDGSWVEDNKDVCGAWYNENNQLRLVIRTGKKGGIVVKGSDRTTILAKGTLQHYFMPTLLYVNTTLCQRHVMPTPTHANTTLCQHYRRTRIIPCAFMQTRVCAGGAGSL